MAAVEQARELLHWTERYEHARHMLRRLKEMIEAYHRQLFRARNALQKARANVLIARCHMYAAKWVRLRGAAYERIKLYLRKYQRELNK